MTNETSHSLPLQHHCYKRVHKINKHKERLMVPWCCTEKGVLVLLCGCSKEPRSPVSYEIRAWKRGKAATSRLFVFLFPFFLMGRCGSFIGRIQFFKIPAMDWMCQELVPERCCRLLKRDLENAIVLLFSQRRQVSAERVHWLIKALKISSFPPAWYPKPPTQAGTSLKTQSFFSLGSWGSAHCRACCCSLSGCQ